MLKLRARVCSQGFRVSVPDKLIARGDDDFTRQHLASTTQAFAHRDMGAVHDLQHVDGLGEGQVWQQLGRQQEALRRALACKYTDNNL